jgi:alkaline phosphatase D
MRGIFYAFGPDIRAGVKLPPFESVHFYPLIARILGLQAGTTDGDISVLEKILHTAGSEAASH